MATTGAFSMVLQNVLWGQGGGLPVMMARKTSGPFKRQTHLHSLLIHRVIVGRRLDDFEKRR